MIQTTRDGSREASPAGVFLMLALLAALVGRGQAQNSRGTILGHVQDSSGAAFAGAKVTATNVDTNVAHHFTTTSVGDYIFVDMIPGTYQVKVEARGFKSALSTGLILEVDQTLRQDFTLDVGQVKEAIVVKADAQMVQTDNTTTGTVVDEKMIEELPSSGRDFNNLLNLSAGAANFSGGCCGPSEMESSNIFRCDGIAGSQIDLLTIHLSLRGGLWIFRSSPRQMCHPPALAGTFCR